MADIDKKITEINKEIISLRRKFHQIPETSMQENQTAEIIANYLDELGLKVRKNVGKTGVTAVLNGQREGRTLAIRSDIDALPIEENTGLEFSSKHEGVMHACGHDGHMAIVLGTAKVLSQFVEEINGKVKFIFQPAEEELVGAKAMLEDNVLQNPPVNAILGLHIWPDIESGFIGVRPGAVMAAVDKFEIELVGKGGHGGIPHKAVDPVVMSSSLIDRIQSVVSREIDPTQSAVITIGKIEGGTAYNIIPDRVKLAGTVRTFNQHVRNYIEEKIKKIVKNVAESFEGDYNLKFENKVPPVFNDQKLTENIIMHLQNLIGESKVITDFDLSMGGEDFALYQKRIPGTYLFLGTKNEKKGITKPIYHPQYNIDEEILSLGIKALSSFSMDYLK